MRIEGVKKYLIIVLSSLFILSLFYVKGISKKEVKLYFSDEQATGLVAEMRDIKGDDFYRRVVEELINGPRDKRLQITIPSETEVLGVELVGKKVVVNFNKELKTEHWGGSRGEILTVYSIVNTLTGLKEIEEVEIWLEGDKIQTLAGHIYINEPLKFNEEIIN